MTQIQRALFSHNISQQLHRNNDFDIAGDKAPSTITIILLLLLLLVSLLTVLPYHVAGYYYCSIIDSRHSNNIPEEKQTNHRTYFRENLRKCTFQLIRKLP